MKLSSILFLLVIPITLALNCGNSVRAKGEEECAENQVCYRRTKNFGCVLQTKCAGGLEEKCLESPTLCCCNKEYCNDESKFEEDENVEDFILAGLLGAAVLVLVIIVIVYFKCIRKRRYAAIRSETETDDMVSYKPMDDNLIEHEDRTDELVQAVITDADKDELSKSLETAPVLACRSRFESKPTLTRIQTYGTTDHITMMEDIASAADGAPTGAKACASALLRQMLCHGAQQFPFSANLLMTVLDAAADIFKTEPTLLEIPVPCVIYGDIHGQYSDLLRWFNLNGWPNRMRCVFLGDFVDRGSHGVEVIALIACLKVLFPTHIFICRGNHEEEGVNRSYTFYDEVKQRFTDRASAEQEKIYVSFNKLFTHLPLAALIGERVLGMHGGISPKLTKLEDIRNIKRPITEFVPGSLACDLVWSDPDTKNKVKGKFLPNMDREPTAGIGQLFSISAVEAACKTLNIDLIIRGHQAPLHGYARWANGQLITLFSAPGYKGNRKKSVNMGACIEAQIDGKLIIKQIKVSMEFRQQRIDDVKNRESQKSQKSGKSSSSRRSPNSK